jgi:hypothetical protein
MVPTFAIYFLAFVCSSLVTITILVACDLTIAVGLMRNPYAHVLAKLRPLDPGVETRKIVSQLAMSEGLEDVSFFISESVASPLTLGKPSGERILVFPNLVVETLQKDQLETVVLHEIYHAKTDVLEKTQSVFDEILMHEPFSWSALLFIVFALLLCLLATVSSLGYAGWPTTFNPIWAALTLAILGFVAVFVLLTIRTLRKEGMMSSHYHYVRELFADAYALLKSQKPQSLREAIKACHEIALGLVITKGLSSKGRLAGLGFASLNSRQEGDTNQTLRGLYTTKTFYRAREIVLSGGQLEHPSLKIRLLSTTKIERLLNEASPLSVHARSVDTNPWKTLGLPQSLRQYIEQHRDLVISFLEYCTLNTSGFNLKKCSSTLGVEPFGVFQLIVWGLVTDHISFQNEL